MSRREDLTNLRFGKLKVLNESEPIKRNKKTEYCWLCLCDCGNFKVVTSKNLKRGNVKSCGCLLFESKTNLKHGMSTTKIYRIWCGMKRRCNSKNDRAYINYGARGIKVCDEWNNSFELFYRWAINNGYKEGLTIERIDNDKGYTPDNCKWATMEEQGHNKRNNKKYTYNGKTLDLTQWANLTGIKRSGLHARLKRGWSFEKAITTPKMKNQYL